MYPPVSLSRLVPVVLDIDPWDTLDLLDTRRHIWRIVLWDQLLHKSSFTTHFELTMGLFYVWIKTMGNSITKELVAFVDREAADEWWRMISTPPSVHVEHVKRISPHLYVRTGGGDLFYSVKSTHKKEVKGGWSSWTEISYTPLSGINNFIHHPSTAIPGSQIGTDHISDRWYFIRCSVEPYSFWYTRTSGTCAVCAGADCDAIHVSSEYRTRFCVRVCDPAVPENFVMIKKDKISIVAPRDYILYIDDAGDLRAKKGYQGETDLLFGDLNNRFVTRAERQVNGEVWEYLESVKRGVGEPWELV